MHSHVGAEHRMDLPHGRVFQGHTFDEDILAAIRLDELRPQIVSFSKDPFAHRDASLRHIKEHVPVFLLAGTALFPTAFLSSFPWPPVVAIGLAVDYATAADP